MVHTCVASEYGVGEFSSTNCDPNSGCDISVLSDESSLLIVSCLGTIVNLLKKKIQKNTTSR